MMKWFLHVLCVCALKSAYSKSIKFSQQDDSREVNKFLDKILHADKFNELADKIADRAVQKISDYQKPHLTAKSDTNDRTYRSKVKQSDDEGVNYSFERSRLQAKHKHGKIDVDAVLKKTALPLDDLKLRYIHLKNKHPKAILRTKDSNRDRNENFKDHGTTSQNYKQLARDIALDFEENIKTLSNENFRNAYGDGGNIFSNTEQNKHLHKAEKKTESETDFLKFGDNASKEKDNTFSRTTRTEGDKQFALLESPDYKAYHEQLALQLSE